MNTDKKTRIKYFMIAAVVWITFVTLATILFGYRWYTYVTYVVCMFGIVSFLNTKVK